MVQFMPTLAKHISRELFASKIESTLIGMICDPVYTIREESTESIIKLSQSLYDSDWLRAVVDTKLQELGANERFMLRI